MQDIVFYAAVSETLGIVRDYANVRNLSAPTLVLGVSARLRMRLFADSESAAPYPVSSFSGIATWKWRMDADFERDSPSKLVADTGEISVQTVTDTVNGESATFTEFTIPISEMNTVELTEWLGTQKKRSGLTGELVGYDSSGNAVFVLQIDDFTVRNRVAGLTEPTPNQQVYLTGSQTELLVSSAMAMKQDKLTSANAGVGIAIDSGGTISASGVPMGAVTGLTAALSGLESGISGKQDRLTSANAGANISIDSNGVISNTYSLPYAATASAGGVMLANGTEVVSGTDADKAVTPAALKTALTGGTPFVPQDVVSSFQAITDLGNAATVSLAAGGAYKLSATSGNHYITVSDVPSGKYGMDAHLELFVGAATLVHALDPLILMDALTPNAVNNCVIEYRDGTARMFVEDHAFGYVVTVAGGTEGTSLDGSLYHGLAGSTASYIVFSHTTDGSTVTLPDATTISRAVNIVGNGVEETIVNLGTDARGPGENGPYQNLSDLYISGGTALKISVNSMTNCIVKDVTAAITGRTTHQNAIFYGRSFKGCTFEHFTNDISASNRLGHGCISVWGSPSVMEDCIISGCTYTEVFLYSSSQIKNCLFENLNNSVGLECYRKTTTGISGCTFSDFGLECLRVGGSYLTDPGSNVTVSGCTFAQPNATRNSIRCYAGGTLTFSGMNVLGSTVYGGGRICVSGGTVSSPTRAGVIDLTGATAGVDLSGDVCLSGLKITGMTAGSPALRISGAASQTVRLTDCRITGNTNTTGGGGGIVPIGNNKHVILSGCTFSGNNSVNGGNRALFAQGGYCELHNALFDSTEVAQSVLFYQRTEGELYNVVLIDGMTCSPGRNLFYYGDSRTIYEVTVRIQADSLNAVSTSQNNADKIFGGNYSVVSVGSYDANGVWIVGGTASFVTNSGSTVSLSGVGTYVNADGTNDLSFTKNDWEPIALRAAIVTDEELTFTGANAFTFHSAMPADAITANPITIADDATLTIVDVSGNTVTITGPTSGTRISNAGALS